MYLVHQKLLFKYFIRKTKGNSYFVYEMLYKIQRLKFCISNTKFSFSNKLLYNDCVLRWRNFSPREKFQNFDLIHGIVLVYIKYRKTNLF